MIGDNAKAVIKGLPGRSATGYAVLLLDAWRSRASSTGNLDPCDFTLLEAFFGDDWAQDYASELKMHFKRAAAPRIEQFRISIDSEGEATTVFPNIQGFKADSVEILASMGSFYFERTTFPLLVMVPLDDTVSASQVTHDLYCFNAAEPGGSYISVSAEADFFTTTDDDTGEGIHHGPKPVEVNLAPGECAKVGDIEGWERDSGMNFELIIHAGVDIDFETTDRRFSLGYDLKSSGGRKITLPGKLKGYTVNPAGRPIRLGEAT